MKTRENPILETCATMWLKYIQRRCTPQTSNYYADVMNRFMVQAPQKLSDLCSHHIEDYIDSVLQTCAPRTANTHLVVVKSFCRWLSARHGSPNVAEPVDKLRVAPVDPRVISEEEYTLLIDGTAGPTRDAIQFLANTGLRRREFCNFTRANIGPDCEYLSIVGKGRKQRIIPCNNVVRELLGKPENARSAPVFVRRYNQSIFALNWRFRSLANKFNIPCFGPHALRHYFATRLMRLGVPISKVSLILGHASIRTTEQIYIHFVPADLIGVTDCLTA